MKKILVWLVLMLMVLVAVVLPVGMALAEGAEALPAEGFDWTPVATVVIRAVAAVLGAFLVYWLEKYVKPWLEEKGLAEAAKRAVYTAEAVLGRFCGEDKWEMALRKMQEKGYSVNTEKVLDALKAAWKELDLSQMLAGEKVSIETAPLQVEEVTIGEGMKPPETVL